jgi:hypothetical protein
MNRSLVVAVVLLSSAPALAQASGEQDQFKQIAQSGLELIKRTPATGPVEAQILLNLNMVLMAVADGRLVLSRPAPPPTVIPGLQGGPAPQATPEPPK